MNTLYQILIYTAMLMAAATGLTKECASVRTPCVQKQLQDQQVNNLDPCTSGVNYVGCLANALQQAQGRGTCGPVVLLAWLQEAYSEAEVYSANCPTATVPSSLRLDACQQQLAACGSYILQAHLDQTQGNRALCSGNVQLFTTCMNKDTGSCTNRTQVDRFRQTEFDQVSCDPSTTATSLAVATDTSAPAAPKTSPPATTARPLVFSTTTTPPSPTTSRSVMPAVFTTAAAVAPTSPQVSSAKSTSLVPPRLTTAAAVASSSSSSLASSSTSSPSSSKAAEAVKNTAAGTSTSSPTLALAMLITTGRSASLAEENPCTVDRMRESGMFHAHSSDPSKFWQCTPWGRAYLFTCPPGTRWRQGYLTCVMR